MQAPRDENRIPVIFGVSAVDETTLLCVEADPISHGLCINDGTTGTASGNNRALKDENRINSLLAASSADGITPVAVYINNGNCLLTKSN